MFVGVLDTTGSPADTNPQTRWYSYTGEIRTRSWVTLGLGVAKMPTKIVVATLVTAFSIAMHMCDQAEAAQIGPLNYGLCGSATDMTAISRALLPEHSLAAYKELAATPIRLQRSGQEVQVSTDTLPPMVVAPPSSSSDVCKINPAGTVMLASVSTIPGVDFAALDSVLEFRRLHPWTLGAAPIDRPSTSINLQTRGRCLFVLITGSLKGSPPLSLGCGASEYYRVDPTTFDVRPFDGCVEGHRHVEGLPGIGGLPD